MSRRGPRRVGPDGYAGAVTMPRALTPAAILAREVARAKRERWEETFALQVRGSRVLPQPERQVRFHPTRGWRLDFGWPELRLAVEIEGLVPGGKGRHQTIGGMTEDLVKYAEALCLGWRVLRVSQAQVRSGQALEWAERAAKIPLDFRVYRS